MKAVLKSGIEFPQDASLVGNTYTHDRLKQKGNSVFTSPQGNIGILHPVAYLLKRNGILRQKQIFAQPVKKSFFITKPKGSLPSSQLVGSLCCREPDTSILYCRKIFI